MRLLLGTIMAFASVDVSIGQAPVMVRDVGKRTRTVTQTGYSNSIREPGKRMRTVTQPGYSYSIYEYEGVFVIGELSLAEYREALALVKPQLDTDEQVIEVLVFGQWPPPSPAGEDIRVRTCTEGCDAGPLGRRAGGGRGFSFVRTAGKLELIRVQRWIS